MLFRSGESRLRDRASLVRDEQFVHEPDVSADRSVHEPEALHGKQGVLFAETVGRKGRESAFGAGRRAVVEVDESAGGVFERQREGAVQAVALPVLK